jgi:RNA 2',3'-cyclic 3'-phosphodiesterase
MRIFVGIALPSLLRRALSEAVLPLRNPSLPVSWTPEENLHMTLKFLGEVQPDRIGDVSERLVAASRGVAPFTFVLEMGGTFPPSGPARVLWVGIHQESLDLVENLQENIEIALSEAGFPREQKVFHPHITVGRVRGRLPHGWREKYIAALAGRGFGVVPVKSFQLYESRLSPKGAVYGALRDFPLEERSTVDKCRNRKEEKSEWERS